MTGPSGKLINQFINIGGGKGNRGKGLNVSGFGMGSVNQTFNAGYSSGAVQMKYIG